MSEQNPWVEKLENRPLETANTIIPHGSPEISASPYQSSGNRNNTAAPTSTQTRTNFRLIKMPVITMVITFCLLTNSLINYV